MLRNNRQQSQSVDTMVEGGGVGDRARGEGEGEGREEGEKGEAVKVGERERLILTLVKSKDLRLRRGITKGNNPGTCCSLCLEQSHNY